MLPIVITDDEMRFRFVRLNALAERLKTCQTTDEKIKELTLDIDYNLPFFAALSSEYKVIVLELIAIEQLDRLLEGLKIQEDEEQLTSLLFSLLPVEAFYRDIGGIVGYQAMLLRFLIEKESGGLQMRGVYHQPVGIDLVEETEAVAKAIATGIQTLPMMAEIYPVGGAADRLRLCDPDTLAPLPAARLQFCGRTLLEGLIRDLQAREYLYYRLFGEQLITPVAMMTSQEKDNHAQIVSLCEENGWFGRPRSSFAFFCQPTVPTIDSEGNWCLMGPCLPLMKPGGHGVIWKVAKDQGIFKWFQELKRRKMLVRQINNPIAGCDYGLVAFTGLGCGGDKAFGFASCFRQVGSAEGVNVTIASQRGDATGYCLTNIEYCDFKKFGIEDEPMYEGSCYSKFPSNTNILFADIEQVSHKVEECPIPGMLVNLKKMTFLDVCGAVQERQVARLESTMQNIADCFVEEFAPKNDSDLPELKTYLTFNHRRKTISTTKKEFQMSSSLSETPEGCYFDHLCNAHELLETHCHFSVPKMRSVEEYLELGGAFDFVYHPALGPFYGIIAQKLRGGVIVEGSEWILEIAEIDVEGLFLDGCLKIVAERVMGYRDLDCDGALMYSERVGRCVLSHVTIRTEKRERGSPDRYWKGGGERKEVCEIVLQGESEFIARDVVFEGNMQIVVEDGMRVTASMHEGALQFHKERIAEGRALWKYEFNDDSQVCLNQKSHTENHVAL